MYKNSFRKRIPLLSLLASSLLLMTSCIPKTAGIEKQPWFVYGKDYVEGYEMAQKSGVTDEAKVLSSMQQIERATKNYLNSKPPNEKEILRVLNSKDDSISKIALGAMALRPLPEYAVIKKIISFLNHPSELHRDFASLALLKVDKSEIRDYQDLGEMIFEIIEKETDSIILARGMESLGKFNNPKYLPFIVRYLKNPDNHLYYYSSFRALKAMDDRYFQQVRSQLQKQGDIETLKAIDRTQNVWETRQQAPPE